MFKKSFGELKNIQSLSTTGVLIAVFVVLKAYATVIVGPTLKISFAFTALAAIGMLFGPVVAVIAAVPCDMIGALLQGGGVLPGFTLVIMFEGLVYGLLLYGYEVKRTVLKNVKLIAAQAIVVFVSQLVLNTAVLAYYGIIGGSGETVFSLIAVRALKNLIEFPVDTVILFAVLIPLKIAHKRIFKAKGGTL